jgi:hypothetical protein
MAEHPTECDFCGKGPLVWRTEEMKFRQWSDKGWVRCSVTLPVGTCAHCHAKSMAAGSDALFEAAFRREYYRLK